MAIEMRQQMKLTQQLVMTPQLQQAIKLLQLSRLELQDVVRQELEENPVLDESLEQEEVREAEQLELMEKEELPLPETAEFKEVSAGEETVREMDWDSYLEGYNYSAGEQYADAAAGPKARRKDGVTIRMYPARQTRSTRCRRRSSTSPRS